MAQCQCLEIGPGGFGFCSKNAMLLCTHYAPINILTLCWASQVENIIPFCFSSRLHSRFSIVLRPDYKIVW